MTSSNKRAFTEFTESGKLRSGEYINELPLKKQKISENNLKSTFIVSSSLFLNSKADHKQFETIFKLIDESMLINDVHIIKEIAEYSTGNIQICSNKKCQNEIPTLSYHHEIYDYEDHNYSAKQVGFKTCEQRPNRYFCEKCMDSVVISDPEGWCDCECCQSIVFAPNGEKCEVPGCPRVINKECDCWCCHMSKCKNCNLKSCGSPECTVINKCVQCSNEYCANCIDINIQELIPEHWDSNDTVCNGCYDETVKECSKCKATYHLLYKGNKRLYPMNSSQEHVYLSVCDYHNCDQYACWAMCCRKGINGETNCMVDPNSGILRYYCNEHI